MPRRPSSQTQQMQAAGRRAIEDFASVRMLALRVAEELEDTTAPHGVRVAGFDEEDSLVTVVNEAIAQLEAK